MAVKVGIVGLGFMGTTHFASYKEISGAEVVAVCDLQAEKLAGDWLEVERNIDTGAPVRADLSRIEKFTDFGEMLEHADADVIDVCVPTFLHADFAVRAINAGKHVFAEKPMAIDLSQCRQMIGAAEAADRFLMVGMVLRFWPDYIMIKEMIDSGRYGRVRSAVLRRLGSMPGSPWYADSALSGQAALDLHLHDVDTIQWFFGVPASVNARGALEPDGGVAHIITCYEFENIPAVVAEGGWLTRPFPFSMSATVMFESATVDFNTARQ
ncbi:MAG: Gfo/Idh/MocA family protein, partial [Planctomycetota bacterium]